jgi:hypothetical protein
MIDHDPVAPKHQPDSAIAKATPFHGDRFKTFDERWFIGST